MISLATFGKQMARISRLAACSGRPLSTKATEPPTSGMPEADEIFHLEENNIVEIPQYAARNNESTDTKRARLLWQSRKRGMLENDLLLSTFAARYLKGMTDDALAQYDKLINGPSNDWDIYNWATLAKPVPGDYKNEMMELLQRHAKNELKESRIRMPSLQ